MTPEQNLQLLAQIQANRRFMLQAYQSNPALLARAEERIRLLFCDIGTAATTRGCNVPARQTSSAHDV